MASFDRCVAVISITLIVATSARRLLGQRLIFSTDIDVALIIPCHRLLSICFSRRLEDWLRLLYVLQVLQHVRLPLLSPKFLVGTVGSDPLIKSDEECRFVCLFVCCLVQPFLFIWWKCTLCFICVCGWTKSSTASYILQTCFHHFRDLVDEAKNYLLLPQERPLMQGPRTRPRKPIRCGEVLFAGEFRAFSCIKQPH